jgi:hypothetical protein
MRGIASHDAPRMERARLYLLKWLLRISACAFYEERDVYLYFG